MATAPTSDLDKLLQLVREAAGQLPPQAVHRLIDHPSVVCSALAVAASTLENHRETVPADRPEVLGDDLPTSRVTARTAKRRLAARTRPGPPEVLLSAAELAARVGVKTRQSVHDWLKKGRVIGWSGAKRGTVFPAAQLDERGRPPPGLDQVLPFFADPYAAWQWLITPLPALDGHTPLERLHAGDSASVVAAAAGQAQGDFA